jgi:DNA-binding beta-propeller fold protein YncE
MSRFSLSAMLIVALACEASAGDPIAKTVLPLGVPGGFVMMPDGITLIASVPHQGELVYFDTVAEKETKRVSVDFKPAAMTLRGSTLYVAGEGSSMVYALDAKTGKQLKEMSMGGDAITHIASHPTKGLIYAATATLKVYSIDPASGTSKLTGATGNFVVVDPIEGSSIFTGAQPPDTDSDIIIKNMPGGRFRNRA